MSGLKTSYKCFVGKHISLQLKITIYNNHQGRIFNFEVFESNSFMLILVKFSQFFKVKN